MNPLTAPYLAAAALLVVAGVQKTARPGPTVQALRTQRLPSGTAAVRLLGAAEVAVGVAALLGVPHAAGLLAAAYAGFTVFVLVPMLRGTALSSCGCFAEPDLPPTPAHLLVTAGFAGCAAAVAAGPSGALTALGGSAALSASVCVSTLVVAGLAYLVLTGLPRLAAATAAPGTAAPGASPAGATAPSR